MPTRPPEEQQHFETCPECGGEFDMRDLGQVFFHAVDHKPHPEAEGIRGVLVERAGDDDTPVPSRLLH